MFEAVRESGGGYSLNTLVTFDGNDGAAPTNAGVIADADRKSLRHDRDGTGEPWRRHRIRDLQDQRQLC